jgi:outer membrane protein assembly factor BamB
MRHFATSLAAAAVILIPPFAQAQDPTPEWRSWRGPNGDGIAAADATPPLQWSDDENLSWSVELPGLGNSSPVIWGGRIYLTAAIDLDKVDEGKAAGAQPGSPNADGQHRFIVFALDRATGKEVWRTTVHEAKPNEKGHVTGSHASASVQCDGKRLIAFFGSRGLYGLDMNGAVLWSKDLGDMETLAKFGEGSTPALHDNTVVIQWDEEGQSFVAGFEASSGEELWWEARETDSSWGSPVVAEVNGKAQAILTGSDSTRAYDLKTGEPVWWCGGMSKNPVNSPLVVGDTLYVMNPYKGNVIQAISLSKAKGEVKDGAGLLWTVKRDAAEVPSPIVVDGLLYYLRDSSGVLSCLDAASGEAHYRAQRLGDIKNIHASPISAAGHIFFMARGGQTAVVREGKEFDLVAMNTLDDTFDATPAFVGSTIYLRGRSKLYCIEAASK